MKQTNIKGWTTADMAEFFDVSQKQIQTGINKLDLPHRATHDEAVLFRIKNWLQAKGLV
jgi:hypothetical protein